MRYAEVVTGRALRRGVPGLRRLVGSGLGRVFGPPPIDPRTGAGDPGLFGPGSASWRVIADPAAIVGGLRALLVQLLHPLAMAGVADHSAFRSQPLGRLRRTSRYVTTVTFGSCGEALAASRQVRRVHRRVRGTAPDGRSYRADDPHLLAWVSVALTSSFLASDRAYAARPAAGAQADAFVAEQSRAAALLDPRVDLDALDGDPVRLRALRADRLPLPMIEDGSLPVTVADLHAAVDRYRPELHLSEQGRQAVRFLRRPPVPVGVRAAYVPALAGALATIPPELRALLGVRLPGPARPLVVANVAALLALLRTVRGSSPVLQAAWQRAAA